MITTIAQASELTAAEEAEKERQEAEQVNNLATINIDKIMVIIEKNSGEAKTFHFHSMSVSSCALDVGFSIYVGFI